MKIDEIKELVTLLENSKLNVLEISESDSKIRLEKANPAVVATALAGNVQDFKAISSEYEQKVKADPVAGQTDSEIAHPVGKPVKSPMVGVFYTSPAPEEDPFVSVGSRVEKGDVLCIVEAMKLMNEIVADIGGEITEVCGKDGDIVEFGQPLFYVK
ncbi:MAG: acetyl-CoA carboxylase biotin carboxyl carrier protein [Eubacteriales bacterium]|nr:acetyl-CoA carboxylase biotin carboxyl carrier protein [Eubacteriales bacterium]MDD4391041.1 acetyl-CoA carboxylase biotin carboxyl carrier protein [Eubacteriales bacterium]